MDEVVGTLTDMPFLTSVGLDTAFPHGWYNTLKHDDSFVTHQDHSAGTMHTLVTNALYFRYVSMVVYSDSFPGGQWREQHSRAAAQQT